MPGGGGVRGRKSGDNEWRREGPGDCRMSTAPPLLSARCETIEFQRCAWGRGGFRLLTRAVPSVWGTECVGKGEAGGCYAGA